EAAIPVDRAVNGCARSDGPFDSVPDLALDLLRADHRPASHRSGVARLSAATGVERGLIERDPKASVLLVDGGNGSRKCLEVGIVVIEKPGQIRKPSMARAGGEPHRGYRSGPPQATRGPDASCVAASARERHVALLDEIGDALDDPPQLGKVHLESLVVVVGLLQLVNDPVESFDL